MSDDKNILQDMESISGAYDGSQELKPGPEFVDEALPGFKKALEARRAIRVFDGQQIPPDVMKDCLKDATLAPSSSNMQPYELYWIRSEKQKKAAMFACMSQPAATTAGEIIVVVARPDQWRQNLKKLLNIITDGGAKELPKPLVTYYKKLIPGVMTTDPFGFLNFGRRMTYFFLGLSKAMVRTPVNKGDHRISAHVQAALAAETLMLSISAHGYDSCPIGGMDAKRLKKILKLPRGAEINMVVSAGRRKSEGLYGPRIRLNQSDLIKEI